MSKRDMPWPEIGARVEVEFASTDEHARENSWIWWTFHGSRRGWVCLMPIAQSAEHHTGWNRLHWFPAVAVACMVEVGDERASEAVRELWGVARMDGRPVYGLADRIL